MELVEVIYEYSRLAEPLTVELAPQSFSPAGVRDGEVDSVRIYIVPIFRCDEVSERIFMAVCSDFRISRCSRCEEHQHCIIARCGIGTSFIYIAVARQFLVKVVPALALAADKDFCL